MARLLAAVNSVSYLLFSTIGIPNVERWGRRKLLMYAAAGQCFCYLIITVMIRYNEKEGYAHQTEVAKASVAFFFLYYVFFGIGFQVSCKECLQRAVTKLIDKLGNSMVRSPQEEDHKLSSTGQKHVFCELRSIVSYQDMLKFCCGSSSLDLSVS
jgi:hypothetical protein